MERSGLRFENFCLEVVKNCLLLIANFGIFLDMFEFLRLDYFSLFPKKLGFGVFLVHPTVVSVLLSASVERCFFSHIHVFFRPSLRRKSRQGRLQFKGDRLHITCNT